MIVASHIMLATKTVPLLYLTMLNFVHSLETTNSLFNMREANFGSLVKINKYTVSQKTKHSTHTLS
jgi:hypothetical protein